jgi:REP-associated tyrosine transposase
MESKAVQDCKFQFPAELIRRHAGIASPGERRSSDRQTLRLSPDDHFYVDRRSSDRHLSKLLTTDLKILAIPYLCNLPAGGSAFKLLTRYRHNSWKLRRGSRQTEGELYSRGYLPHRNKDSLIQHVTVHLADSMPGAAVENMELSIRMLPDELQRNERRERLLELMDAGHGSCVLRNPGAAEIVQNAFLYFHEIRYCLHAWVVMPNHFHVLFEPIDEWPMAKIVSSWKKFTACKIREYLRKTDVGIKSADLKIDDPHIEGTLELDSKSAGLKTGDPRGEPPEKGGKQKAEAFWHREFRDRYIRDEEHYYDTIEYIHNNPVKAGLTKRPEAWPWSSAGMRVD